MDLWPSSDDEQREDATIVSLANRNHPLQKRKPKPGHGTIYWIRPRPFVSASNSNGYIGQTEQALKIRLSGHKTPGSGCFGIANAIKEHGLHAFTLQELETEVPKADLNAAEMRWIAEKNTWHNGYNCGPGGKVSTMVDPEVKARHKKATKEAHNTPEYLERARKHSQELAKRPDWLQAVRSNALAQHQDPKKKARLSEGQKRGWVKRKAAGKTASISASMKKRLQDPEHKAKLVKTLADCKSKRSQGQKDAKARLTPEQRSEAVRKGWAKRRACV